MGHVFEGDNVQKLLWTTFLFPNHFVSGKKSANRLYDGIEEKSERDTERWCWQTQQRQEKKIQIEKSDEDLNAGSMFLRSFPDQVLNSIVWATFRPFDLFKGRGREESKMAKEI